MTKEGDEVLIIDTDHEEGEISDDDEEVILMQGGGTSRTSSRNLDHIDSQPSEWAVNYDDRGRHTVPSYKRKRQIVQQNKHHSHTVPKYQSWDNTCGVKRGTRPEVAKKKKAHAVRSVASIKSLPKTKKLERHQKTGHNRSRMRYSSSSSSSYKTRSSSLSSSCSGSSSSSSCSTCSSSSCRSSVSFRSQSRSRSRSRSQSRSQSRNKNKSQSPRHRSKKRDKKNAKAVHTKSHRSQSKCSPHRSFSDRMSPRTKLKKLAAFDNALRQAKGSKRFSSIDSTSKLKTALSEEKALASAVARLGKAKDKAVDNEENEILESEKKPKPGSLGEMLLKNKLKMFKKFTQQTKGTRVGPKDLEKKEDDDELELRLVALQTAFKFLNALDKMPKEDDTVEEHLKICKGDNHRTEVTDKKKYEIITGSLAPDPAKGNEDIIVYPTEAKDRKNIPLDENSINDLDLQNILTTDTYLTEGKSHSEMFNLISPDSDQDPVDMDISSSSDTDVEDNVQKLDEEEGSKGEVNNENDDLLVKYGERKGDGDNFQIPVEWAYMMPPPPPPDHPPNDIKNINSWCYEQNMYLQTLSSYGKEDYNEDYGQMRWGSLQNNHQTQQQQLQQQGAWDEAVMHSQCNNEKLSFKDQKSEKDSGQHHHNYPLYYMQDTNQEELDYRPLCEENYRSRESVVGTEIGTLKDAPAQHYEAFMSAVLQQRDVGMIEGRKGNQESHAEGTSESTTPKSKVGSRPGSVLIEIRTDSVVNGKSKQEKKAEARRRRKERMKERAKQLKANLKEITAQETSEKMKSEIKGDLSGVVIDGASNMEIIEEDEDLLRAKLLIDLSRKKQQTKDSSQSSLATDSRGIEMLQSNQDSLSGIGSPMSSASPASPASPAHLVRRVAHKNALSHTVPGRVKESSPASPSHTSLTAVSRHLRDIGGNSLDPKSKACDIPTTSKDTTKPFKIPKIKPVIISLESDEESDGHENAVANRNVRTKSPVAGASEQPSVVSNSIDLLLRTFRNASVAESSEKGSATPPVVTKKKPAITDVTPQAVKHLSRTQQAEYKWLKEQLRKKTLLKKHLQAKTKKPTSKVIENSGKDLSSKLEASCESRSPAYSLEGNEKLKEDLNLSRDVDMWNEGKDVPNLPSLDINAQEGEHTSTVKNYSQSISTPVTQQHRVVKRNSGGLEIRLRNDAATSACATPENVDPIHEISREKTLDDIVNSEKPEPVNESDNEEETLRALLLSSLKRKQRHKENVSHNVTPEVCLHGNWTRNCMCDVCMPSPKDLHVIVNSDGTVNENKETVNKCEGRKVVYDNGIENGIHDGVVSCGKPEVEGIEGTARAEDKDTKSYKKEEDSSGDPEVVTEEEPTDQDIFLQSDWMIIDEAEEDDSDCLNSVGSSHDDFIVDGGLQSASLQKPSLDVKEKLDLVESMSKLSEEMIDEESCEDSTTLGDENMKDKCDSHGECVKNSELVNHHSKSLKQKGSVVVEGFKSVCSQMSKSDNEIKRKGERKDIFEKGMLEEAVENSSAFNDLNCSGYEKGEAGMIEVAQEFQGLIDGSLQQCITNIHTTTAKTDIEDTFSFSAGHVSMETIGKEINYLESDSPLIRSDDNGISKMLGKSSKMEEVLPKSNTPESSNFIALSLKQNGNEGIPTYVESHIQDELTSRNDSVKKVENDTQNCKEVKQRSHLAEQDKVQTDFIHCVESKVVEEKSPLYKDKTDKLLKDEQGSRNTSTKLKGRKELVEVQKEEPEKQDGEHIVKKQGEQVLNQVLEDSQEQESNLMLEKKEEVLNQVPEKQENVLHQVPQKQVEVSNQVPDKQTEVLNCTPVKQEEQVINQVSEKEEDVEMSKQISERQEDEQSLGKDLKKRQTQDLGEDRLQTSRKEKLVKENLIHSQRNLDKVQENVIKVEDTGAAEDIRSKQIQLLKRVETVYLLKRKVMNKSVSKVSDLLHSVMKDKKEQGELSEEVRKLRHQLHNMEKLCKAKSSAVENKLSQIKQLETQLETDKSKMEQLERRGKALGKQVYGSCYCLPKVAKMVPPNEMKKGAKSGAILNTSRSLLSKSEVSRNPVSQKNIRMQSTRNENVLGNNKKSETQSAKNLSKEKQNLKPIQVKIENQGAAVPFINVCWKTHDSQNEIPSPKTGVPKVQVKPSSESSPAGGSAISVDCSLQKLDEMSELCPYDLLGRCNDDSCLYQHLRQKTSSEKEETSTKQKQENGKRAVKERARGATGNEEGILQTGRAAETSVEKEFKQTAITFSSKVSNIISDVTQLIKKSTIRNTGHNNSDKESRKCRSDSELQNTKEVKVVVPGAEVLQTEPYSSSFNVGTQSQEGHLNHLQSDCSKQTVCTPNAEHSMLMTSDFNSLPATQEQETVKPDCVVSDTQILAEEKVSSVSEPGFDTKVTNGTLVKETELASETLAKETRSVKEIKGKGTESVTETQDIEEVNVSCLKIDSCKSNSGEVSLNKVSPKRRMRAKRSAYRNTSSVGTKRRKLIKESDVKTSSMCHTFEDECEAAKGEIIGGGEETVSNVVQNADTFQSGRVNRCGASVNPKHAGPSRGRSRVTRTRSKSGCQKVKLSAGARQGQKENKRGRGKGKRRSC